jgi:hypothetical protein
MRGGKFWTSAGITAGFDLAPALTEDDRGGCASPSCAPVASRRSCCAVRAGLTALFDKDVRNLSKNND